MGYNVAGLLCYLPSCCCLLNAVASVLWLATEPKDNRFLRFHSIQGLLLFGAGFVLGIVFQILGVLLGIGTSAVPSGDIGVAAGGIGSLLLFLIQMLCSVVLLVFHIIGMIKANKGEMWKIPVIGNIAEKNS